MTTAALLAKSGNAAEGREPVSLAEHTKSTLSVAKTILELIQDDLPQCVDQKSLKQLVLIAAVLHDIGKANNIFQQKIRQEYKELAQPIRHEVLGALLITGKIPGSEDFSAWLKNILGEEYKMWILSWIVGGHHLKMHHGPDYEPISMVKFIGIPNCAILFPSNGNSDERQQVDKEYKQIIKLLESAIKDAGFGVETPCPELSIDDLSTQSDDDNNHLMLTEDYIYESEDRSDSLEVNEKLLTAIAKGVLISADIAASALWTSKESNEEDISAAVCRAINFGIDDTDLDKIIQDKTGPDKPLKEFQKQAGKTNAKHVVLEAACGGGKTVAAYNWAKQYKGRKLFFCYPTTGTATAGYQDYLLAQTKLERDLIHSRAEVDIARMRDNEANEYDKETIDKDEKRDSIVRVESLRLWGQKVVACTVDTVLGLMQNQRRGLYSFPAILRGAFVFDEIHNYDMKLFGALLRFLKTFPDLPILLMTASLSEKRRDEIREISKGIANIEIQGDDASEQRKKRYQIERLGQADSCPYETAIETIIQNAKAQKSGKISKILWVCNTVRDAQDVYDRVTRQLQEKQINIQPILYHSRFRYCDRVRIQDQIISGFKSDHPILAVTTQICEMSLDISANMLITATPPFAALVQRLGRLNRQYSANGPAPCFIYTDGNQDLRPYRRSDIERSEQLISGWEGKTPISQEDLQKKMKSVEEIGEVKAHSAWLDDTWESGRSPLREGGTSITVLLEQDIPDIMERAKANGRKQPAARDAMEWTIPIPIPNRNQDNPKQYVGGYPVYSDTISYDEKRGAAWVGQKQ